MDGQLAELMNELNPDFKKQEDGIMYLRCIEALYEHVDCMDSLKLQVYFMFI